MRKQNTFIVWTILSIGLLMKAGCAEKPGEKSASKPNLVLLFSVDTLRADHLSCYGYERPTTPFIDSFASRAVLFKNAITQGAVTAPAHMSIFTSLFPVVHQVDNPNPFNEDEAISRLADDIPTWAQLLEENGWVAHGLHGGGPVSSQFGFDRGFETYRDAFFFAFHVDYYRPEREIATIRKLVKASMEEQRPLFLFLHHYLCHDPYIKGPPEFNQRFLDEPVAGLPLTRDDLKRYENGAINEESFWDNIDLDNPDHLRHLIALYDGSILYTDHIFRQVIEVLQQEGIYEQSLIILTADHGEEFNEHGGYRHWKLFRENLHVPLIVKFPGKEFSGREIVRTVRTIDLLPSILDYLGLPLPPHIQGVSFLPLLSGTGSYDPPLVSQARDILSPEDVHLRESVRFMEDGYVYSNQLSAGLWENSLSEGQPEWLFEIAADPREQVNLIAEKPEIAARMRSRADEILQEHRALRDHLGLTPGETTAPGEDLHRQLKSLGYLQ